MWSDQHFYCYHYPVLYILSWCIITVSTSLSNFKSSYWLTSTLFCCEYYYFTWIVNAVEACIYWFLIIWNKILIICRFYREKNRICILIFVQNFTFGKKFVYRFWVVVDLLMSPFSSGNGWTYEKLENNVFRRGCHKSEKFLKSMKLSALVHKNSCILQDICMRRVVYGLFTLEIFACIK